MTMHMHNGAFHITVPVDSSKVAILETIFVMRSWIEEHLQQYLHEQKNRKIPEEIFVPLQSTWFKVHCLPLSALHNIGKTKKILVKNQTDSIYYLEQIPNLVFFGNMNNLDLVKLALQKWGLAKGKELLPRYLQHLAAVHRFCIPKVFVRNQKSRWGSCGQDRKGGYQIQLNWRAVFLPIPLLRQLCQHELCHTLHMNHSKAFHAAMQRLNSCAEKTERELTQYDKTLSWWTKFS